MADKAALAGEDLLAAFKSAFSIANLRLILSPMLIAARSLIASFANSVVVIIFCSSEKQMFRTNTTGIITCMTNQKFFIKSSVKSFIHEPVRASHNSINFKKSVAVFVFSACPKPALVVRQFNLSPEINIFKHNRILTLCQGVVN